LEWREKKSPVFVEGIFCRPLRTSLTLMVNHILPGIVDCHTHFGAFLPYEDDVVSETRSAAAGGVTTVFHVILEQKSVFERVSYYIETTKRLATVDMCFWAVCMTEQHLEEIDKCRKRGLRGFKFFMAYKGDEMKKVGIFGIDLSYLFRGMEKVKNAGGLVIVHAENYELLKLHRRRYDHKNDFRAFCRSRPPLCEVIDADSACRMAEKIGVSLYIVHVGAGGCWTSPKNFGNEGIGYTLKPALAI